MFRLDKNKSAVSLWPRFARASGRPKWLQRGFGALGVGLFSLFLLNSLGSQAVLAAEKHEESANLHVDLTSAEERKAQGWEAHAEPISDKKPDDESQQAAAAAPAQKAETLRHSLVRLPMLPNRAIESALPEARRSKSQKKEEAAKQPQKPDPEAYAAFAAYKKKQLEALESDRQTLQALQEAIHELGLSQKLSFSGGSLTPSKNGEPLKQSPTKK